MAATHLNVSNRQMCGCTGFLSGTYHKSYYIIIDQSIMIQAFRFIEISNYDDGGQVMPATKLCLEAVKFSHTLHVLNIFLQYILHLKNAPENTYFVKMSL